eukprot:13681963-Alexandrium_andersonii.AAC.1
MRFVKALALATRDHIFGGEAGADHYGARLRALSQRQRPRPYVGDVPVPGFADGEPAPPRRSDRQAARAHRGSQRARAARPDDPEVLAGDA